MKNLFILGFVVLLFGCGDGDYSSRHESGSLSNKGDISKNKAKAEKIVAKEVVNIRSIVFRECYYMFGTFVRRSFNIEYSLLNTSLFDISSSSSNTKKLLSDSSDSTEKYYTQKVGTGVEKDGKILFVEDITRDHSYKFVNGPRVYSYNHHIDISIPSLYEDKIPINVSISIKNNKYKKEISTHSIVNLQLIREGSICNMYSNSDL